jgi:hypothetical protein
MRAKNAYVVVPGEEESQTVSRYLDLETDGPAYELDKLLAACGALRERLLRLPAVVDADPHFKLFCLHYDNWEKTVNPAEARDDSATVP